jgi:hypothetical protein
MITIMRGKHPNNRVDASVRYSNAVIAKTSMTNCEKISSSVTGSSVLSASGIQVNCGY